MPTLRQQVEENVVVWLLGVLLTGFLAGIGTLKAIHEFAGLETVPKSDRKAYEEKLTASSAKIDVLQKELAKTASATTKPVAVPLPATSEQRTPRPFLEPTKKAVTASAEVPPKLLDLRVRISYHPPYSAQASQLRKMLRDQSALVDSFYLWQLNENGGVPAVYYSQSSQHPATKSAAAMLASEVTKITGIKTYARPSAHEGDITLHITKEW